MSIESVNKEFEVFIRKVMAAHECAKENVESDFRLLMERTVKSCATMFGFSAKEALKRLDSNGNIVVNEIFPDPKILKELEKAEKLRAKELEKAGKIRAKEFEKAQKLKFKELEKEEKAEKIRAKELEKATILRIQEFEKAEKVNESLERSSMKEEDAISKAAEKNQKKAEKNQKKAEKKQKKAKKNVNADDSDGYDSSASTVVMTDSEDDETKILFQNVKLVEEINSIRQVKSKKNLKKLSEGVKLARQILDI